MAKHNSLHRATLRTQIGAALIEFAIVAVILLGVLLPGVVSIGKAVSELTAASQAAYLGTRLGAEERVDLVSDSSIEQIQVVQNRVASVVNGRVLQTMEPMSRTAATPQTEVRLFRDEPSDPDHWMISTRLEARFPVILTDIPVKVVAVSSVLNLQPETTQDLTTPQRLQLAGQSTFSSYSCLPVRCYGGAGCNPTCCPGDTGGLGIRFCGGNKRFGGGDADLEAELVPNIIDPDGGG